MLKEKVTEDIKEAMKTGDSFRVGVLRMLASAFGNAEIAARGGADLTEADYQQVIKREVKKRNEAIEMYKTAGRVESAENEQKELELLSGYLPAQMAEDEVKAIVESVIAEKGIDNMGVIIGEVKARTDGAADGGLIAKLVKERIG